MQKKIVLTRNWRHGRGMIHTGVYRIPEDMSEEMADRALKEAGAEMLAAPEPSASPSLKVSEPEKPETDPLDALRAEYRSVTGDDADGRWGEPRLKQEIAKARRAVSVKDGAPENKLAG